MYSLLLSSGRFIASQHIARAIATIHDNYADYDSPTAAQARRHIAAIERLEARGESTLGGHHDILAAALNFRDAIAENLLDSRLEAFRRGRKVTIGELAAADGQRFKFGLSFCALYGPKPTIDGRAGKGGGFAPSFTLRALLAHLYAFEWRADVTFDFLAREYAAADFPLECHSPAAAELAPVLRRRVMAAASA